MLARLKENAPILLQLTCFIFYAAFSFAQIRAPVKEWSLQHSIGHASLAIHSRIHRAAKTAARYQWEQPTAVRLTSFRFAIKIKANELLEIKRNLFCNG